MGVILSYFSISVINYIKAQNAVALAQEVRLLNQRYMKEVLLASKGVPQGHSATASALKGSLTALRNGGEAVLISGKYVQVPPADQAEIAGNLDELYSIFGEEEIKADEFFKENELTEQKDTLLDEMYESGLNTQAAADQVVAAYDRHLDAGMVWKEESAVAVELAERQRMLLQQHIKQILFVANGIPADYQKTRMEILNATKVLSEGGSVAVSASQVVQVEPAAYDDIRFSLDEFMKRMQKFTSVSNEYLMITNRGVEHSILMRNLSDLNADFHVLAENAWGGMRGHYEARITRVMRESLLAGILLAIFGVVLMVYFVNSYMIRPLVQVRDGVRRLVAGNITTSVSGCHRDEIGEVATAVNQLTRQMQNKMEHEKFLRLRGPRGKDRIQDETTVIGRLPGEEDGFFNERQVFQQLVSRTRELESRQAELLSVNEQLKEQTQSLSTTEEKMRITEDQIEIKNRELAKQAEEYRDSERKLLSQQEELHSLNRSLAQQTAEQAAELNKAYQALREKTAALLKKEEQLELALGKIRNQPDQGAAGLISTHRELELSARGDEALIQKIGEQSDEIRRLNQLIQSLEAQILGERQKLAEDQQDPASARAGASTGIEQIKEIYSCSTSAERRLDEAVRRLTGLMEELKISRTQTRSLESQVSEKILLISRMEGRLKSAQASSDEKTREITRIRRQVKTLEEELGDKMARLTKTVEDLSTARRQAESQVAAVGTLRMELARRESRIRELEEKLRERDGELSGFRSELDDKGRIGHGTNKRLEAAMKDLLAARRLMDEQVRQMKLMKHNEMRIHAVVADKERVMGAIKRKVGILEAELEKMRSEKEEYNVGRQALEARLRRALAEKEEEGVMTQEAQKMLREAQEALDNCKADNRLKAESLKAAEKRLQTTREALKASIDELGDRKF